MGVNPTGPATALPCAYCDSPDGSKWHRLTCVEVTSLAAPAADGLDVKRLAKALQSMNQHGWPWDPTAKDYWTLYAAAIAAAYLDSGEADGRSNEQQMRDGDRRQWPSREPGEEG